MLCQPCFEERERLRIERLRAERAKKVFGFIGLAAAVLFVYQCSQRQPHSNNSKTVEAPEIIQPYAEIGPSATDQPTVTETDTGNDNQVANELSKEPNNSEKLIEDAPQPKAVEEQVPFEIARAISRALNGNDSAEWVDRGARGYAVASAPSSSSAGTCRSVRVTRINGQDQDILSEDVWCRSGEFDQWQRK